MLNTVIFWENYPYLVTLWILFYTFWIGEGSVGLFYCFFVDISAISRVAEFILIALRSEPIAGPYGLKIIFPLNFGAPLLFYLSDFFKFLRRILIARMRYTIEMCIHILSSYTNKRALGANAPPALTRMCVDDRNFNRMGFDSE